MAAKNKILCSVVVALLALGFYDVFVNVEDNGCSMTYMFEYPSYIATTIDEKIKQRFPQYSLLLYGEGDYIQQSRGFKLKGIPVLFIPGNAGSYRQVRSLGSVALRKAKSRNFHFNYFTIDFNEELTGVYGGTLDKQTEYVHECIKYILGLYKKKKNPPTSVVLVGHSMGGVIARALFTLPRFQRNLVHTIITQATPHTNPVIGADKQLVDFYSKVNKYWKEHMKGARLSDVTVLSVSGGHRDTMVRSGLTSLENIVAPNRGLSVNSMSIPRVWLSTDHLCVVWCKELVLATKRALFQMVDSQTKQISSDPEYRMRVFRHHFLTHDGSEMLNVDEAKSNSFEEASFELATETIIEPSKKPIHYLFPVEQSDESDKAFAIVAGVSSGEWLFVCEEGNSTACSKGVDISSSARVIPPLKSDIMEALVDLNEYPDAKHVVVKIPSGQQVPIKAEVYNTNQRSVEFTLPGPFSLGDASVAVEMTEPEAVFYSINMVDFNAFHLAYTAKLEPLMCDSNIEQDDSTTLRLHISWAEGQDMFSVAAASDVNKLPLKLPSGWPSSNNQTAQLYAYLNPKCRYSIKIVWSLQDKMGQIVRFHANLLPSFVVVVLVYTICFQLRHVSKDQAIDSFNWMQSTYAKPTAVALTINMFRGVVKYDPLDSTYELRSLEDRNISFSVLPMVFFIFGYAILTILASIVETKVALWARFLFMLKGTKADEHQLNQGGPTPWLMYAVLGGITALSVATCGTLGLVVLLFLYFFKVVGLKTRIQRLSHCLNIHGAVPEPEIPPPNDTINAETTNHTTTENNDATSPDTDAPAPSEDATPKKKVDPDAEPKPKDLSPLGVAKEAYNFHLAIMMLLWCLVVLNGPALVVWFKNISHSIHLVNDPSMVVSAAVCSIMSVLLDGRYTLPSNRECCKVASWVFHGLSILMVLYTLESTYLLSYFITAVLAILSTLQLF
ncbi:GPI inositol-deacylase-like [Asterias rubens]|uniref:GPI inositol-deacylase-like n=1 Tax=Asterias rubens TaxID=7604 RepID=UPI0014553BB3|nr:GPI inositol-deacylase-like [Asterias rubens]